MNYGIFWAQLRNFWTQIGRLTAGLWNGSIHINEKGEITAPNWSIPKPEQQ